MNFNVRVLVYGRYIRLGGRCAYNSIINTGRDFAGWKNLNPHMGNDRITQCDVYHEYRMAPTRQLPSIPIPIAVSGSCHTRKTNQCIALDAVIYMQDGPPQKRFFVGCSSPFTRLANTSRLFALGASDVCLVGEHPTRSVPAL